MKRWSSVLGTAAILCILLSLRPAAAADTAIAVTPDIAAQIDAMARAQIHAGRTPGLAIGVVESGRIVYARGFGFADAAHRVAMTPDTEFYAGGLTRQFTAAAMLLLVQDGKISLDDHLTKYVPEFHNGAGITVGQLLMQTSGLPPVTRIPAIRYDPTRPLGLDALFDALDRMAPPVATNGYVANPLNNIIAALVVERASGVPLSDYLEQHVFIPLIMDHSFLAGDSGISPRRAIGYVPAGRGFAPAPLWDPSWMSGDTGLVTTIYDLAKWDLEMPILLRVDATRTLFATSSSVGPTHYGLGWVIDRRGGKDFIWSNGASFGFRAFNALLPEEHVGIIVFSNADGGSRNDTEPEEIGARVLDLIVPPRSARMDNAIVERARDWLGRLTTGQIERGELTASFSAYLTDDLVAHDNFGRLGPLTAIVPLSSTSESNGDTLYEFLVRFRRGQYHYDFELTADGKIDGLRLTA
jgi:D-alanyl-D-alanine carboxypeptidase